MTHSPYSPVLLTLASFTFTVPFVYLTREMLDMSKHKMALLAYGDCNGRVGGFAVHRKSQKLCEGCSWVEQDEEACCHLSFSKELKTEDGRGRYLLSLHLLFRDPPLMESLCCVRASSRHDFQESLHLITVDVFPIDGYPKLLLIACLQKNHKFTGVLNQRFPDSLTAIVHVERSNEEKRAPL